LAGGRVVVAGVYKAGAVVGLGTGRPASEW
jgi:hypothetical protein